MHCVEVSRPVSRFLMMAYVYEDVIWSSATLPHSVLDDDVCRMIRSYKTRSDYLLVGLDSLSSEEERMDVISHLPPIPSCIRIVWQPAQTHLRVILVIFLSCWLVRHRGRYWRNENLDFHILGPSNTCRHALISHQHVISPSSALIKSSRRKEGARGRMKAHQFWRVVYDMLLMKKRFSHITAFTGEDRLFSLHAKGLHLKAGTHALMLF